MAPEIPKFLEMQGVPQLGFLVVPEGESEAESGPMEWDGMGDPTKGPLGPNSWPHSAGSRVSAVEEPQVDLIRTQSFRQPRQASLYLLTGEEGLSWPELAKATSAQFVFAVCGQSCLLT